MKTLNLVIFIIKQCEISFESALSKRKSCPSLAAQAIGEIATICHEVIDELTSLKIGQDN